MNGADLPGSGYFAATLNLRGVCTARFTESGKTYIASGKCSADGMLALDFGGKSDLLASELELNLTGSEQFSGMIATSNWTSRLVAKRNLAKTNTVVSAGKYTMVFAASENAVEPGGYGYGTVRVDRNGSVSFSGWL